jgi:hypothetical protein
MAQIECFANMLDHSGGAVPEFRRVPCCVGDQNRAADHQRTSNRGNLTRLTELVKPAAENHEVPCAVGRFKENWRLAVNWPASTTLQDVHNLPPSMWPPCPFYVAILRKEVAILPGWSAMVEAVASDRVVPAEEMRRT